MLYLFLHGETQKMNYKNALGVLTASAIVFAVIGLIVIVLMGLRQPIQSGTYTGQTIDYSHQRGLIFQTNDLTTKTNDRSSAREYWCVPDNRPKLVNKVRNIEQGEKILINYYAPLWMFPGTCGDPSKVIKSVEPVNTTE